MPDGGVDFAQIARDSCVHRTIGAFGVTLRSELKQVLRDFASIYPPASPDSTARASPAIQGIKATRQKGNKDLGRQKSARDAKILNVSSTEAKSLSQEAVPVNPRGLPARRDCIPPAARFDTGTGAKPTIHLEVRKAGRTRLGRRLFQVLADGREVGGRCTRNRVFPFVEWGINLRIMDTRNEYLQFHAASMSFQGRGFIFAGDSGCGKTTLAAILMARGWRYLCDEFALVDMDGLYLQPFPKALCIKAGSNPVIRRLGLPFARRRDYIKASKGRVGYVSPYGAGADAIGEPTPVRVVVFPRYHPESRPQLRRVSRGSAAVRLFQQCFNRDRFPDAAIPVITKLVSEAECFELEVGAAEETCQVLESAFSIAPSWEARPASVSHDPPRARSSGRHAVDPMRTRREMLRIGAKLAYVAPAVLTLSAHKAFAAASDPSGICSTAKHTGQLCETDTDCCSRNCALGICK